VDTLLELTRRAESTHFWFRGFRRFVAPLLDRAVAGRSDLSVLDCGCGTGHNLQRLEQCGAAVGIDLTAAGLAVAAKAGRRVARADATRLPFPSNRFDLVTSFEMLQCVPDDAAAVAEIARVLRPGGYFVGSVAALDVLHGDHSLLSQEVRRYTRGTLLAVLRGAGLHPIVIRYAFASLFPLMIVGRTLQRLRGARPAGRDITVPSAPINWVFSMMLAAEASLAAHVPMPIGSSLVFLAVKS
jgi:SAM-dependent methyltransferase